MMQPDSTQPSPDDPPTSYMEIDVGRGRRWRGFIAFVFAFLGVAGVLVCMFVYLTASVALSVTVVLIMLAGMGLMGWLTARNLDGRE